MTLVVGATPAEVAWAREGVAVGIGPVEAAIGTTRALLECRPEGVLHVGLAGARREAGIPLGAVVLGSASRYCDLAAALPSLVRELAPDAALLQQARAALPEARVLPIGTSAAVGGSSGAPVEAMEGFAVLRACALLGVPAVELRAVSNEIEEADRARWDFAGALAALARAGVAVCSALER